MHIKNDIDTLQERVDTKQTIVLFTYALIIILSCLFVKVSIRKKPTTLLLPSMR